jgi:hypothetical protein
VKGDMAFQEISEVVPWLELAYDQGQDLSAPQFGHDEGKPRVFKTHAWAPHCPKGAKYVPHRNVSRMTMFYFVLLSADRTD